MRGRHQLRRLLAAAALAGPLGLAGTAQAAGGLFDAIGAIFGADPEPPRNRRPVPYGYDIDDGAPLGVTVRARRKPGRGRPVARRAAPAKPPADLDPARNPTWYLEDPTLRRGDIVVLHGEVLVFQGGRAPYSREDFTSLDKSRLSKAERELVGAMARLPRASPSRATARNRAAGEASATE